MNPSSRTSTGLAQLAPISWSELWRLIRTVPGHERWAGTVKERPREAETTGALLSLCFPLWADELAGTHLPKSRLQKLVVAQAHVLTLVQAHDAYIDREEESGPEVLPLAALAHRKLAELFPDPAHSFWDGWARLCAEQAESARWEAANPRERFSPSFVYKLGRKGALLRWPAFAIAPPLDADFAHLLSVFQMRDDLLDYESDAAKGQPNALVAATGHARGLELHVRAQRAVTRVHRAIDAALDAVRGPAPLVAHLRARGQNLAIATAHEAHRRSMESMLAALTG